MRMKKTKRESVFETNSSSVHTLVFPRQNYKHKFDEDVDFRDGVLRVKCGDFSECGEVRTQRDKLSYLVSFIICAAGQNFYEVHEISTYESWRLNNLFVSLKDLVPDLKDIIAEDTTAAKFDHQTHPSNCDCCVDYENVFVLEAFLFNPDVYIDMDRD